MAPDKLISRDAELGRLEVEEPANGRRRSGPMVASEADPASPIPDQQDAASKDNGSEGILLF